MRWDLTSDQEFFRETTARFLDDQVPVATLRGLRDDAVGFDAQYWRRGAELGWTSLLVSEEHGGGSISGDGLADLSLIAFEFGAHAAPGPLVTTNVVAGALSDAGDAHTDTIAALLAGETVASWCWGEPAPGDRLGEVALEVRVDGADVVLNGVKRPAESAGAAAVLLVTGRTGDGLTQVLVPTDAPGVSVTPLTTVDLTRRCATVTLTDVRVPIGAVVGEVGGAAAAVEHQLQVASALLSAESTGAMQSAFDMTVEWAFARYSFGRPLASYQELKHRFADMKMWLEASHAASDAAVVAIASGAADAADISSAAKAFAGEFGAELAQDCVQIHGGIGVTFEHDLHLYLRRITLNRALYGTPADHRQRLATILINAERSERPSRATADAQSRPATTASEATQEVEEFRERARAWIAANLRSIHRNERSNFTRGSFPDDEELAAVARDREVQRMLFDAGFAGVCVPREYGGQGLTPAHQNALNEELVGYEFPTHLQSPTMSPCMAVLLDFGTHEQKLRHIPAILRGEEIWIQFLSEPSGGSDVAGALTSAVRDGDEWILNGSKVWSTGAWWSDWALCLARTNWDVPKHRGLTVFMFPIDQPDIEIQRIEMLNGNKEFCQEFMTDLRVPDADRIGEVDQGWTVGIGWMFHERMAMAHNEPVITWPPGGGHGMSDPGMLVEVARAAGRLDDPVARDLIGDAYMTLLVGDPLQQRLGAGIAGGHLSDQAASIGRLYGWEVTKTMMTTPFELAGAAGGAWSEDDGAVAGHGLSYMVRQAIAIAGGTIEMARNVISERVLGMPREAAFDRDVAFRDVPRGPSAHG